MKGEVARLYGAWNEERGVANRRTIVIDKQGRISAVDQTEHNGIARDQREVVAAASRAG